MTSNEALPLHAQAPLLATVPRIPQLHVRELQAFLAVAEAGTFREAGRHLFLHGSTVSKLVNRLERRLEFQLVVRTTRGVDLTPAGVAALDPVRTALDALTELALLAKSRWPHVVR